MFAALEIAAGFLHLKFGSIDLGQALGALDLQVLVVEPAKQIVFMYLVPNIDRQLRNASVNFWSHRHLVRRTDISRSVDDEADVPGFHHRRRRTSRCVTGLLKGWAMAPKEISSGAQSTQNDKNPDELHSIKGFCTGLLKNPGCATRQQSRPIGRIFIVL